MSEIIYKRVETIDEFIDAIRIRVNVFIIEQKCPAGWEPGELDKAAEHFIAIEEGVIAATVRLREQPPGSMKIESMAVDAGHRGRNLGLGLTRCVVRAAQERGPDRIWMQAQCHARGFYERSGFTAVSGDYDLFDLGIPHVTMEFKGTDQSGWPHA